MDQDTRSFLARRIQAVALRVANGPGERVQPGYIQVPEETFAAMSEAVMGEDENEPLDPEDMKRVNLEMAMHFNDAVSPAVTHAGSVRKQLIEEGFSDEAAEHLAGNLFLMATNGIMGTDPDDYE